MNITSAIKLAESILTEKSKEYPEYPELRFWKVYTNRRKNAFGVCRYNNKRIELSEHLIPNCKKEAVINVILHEIAHAVTRGHNHDIVWKNMFIKLGGDGQRCGSDSHYFNGEKTKDEIFSKISKYTLVCPVCDHTAYLSRKPKRSYSCAKHGNKKYDETYKMKLIQNY